MSEEALHLEYNLDKIRGNKALIWPDGICVRPFDPDRHSRQARALLNASYAGGGGTVQHHDEWWARLSTDVEFDPDLCFVCEETAISPGLAAFAQCWRSGFVKDIAVAQSWRHKGIGTTLFQLICQTFRDRGLSRMHLKVEANNPNGAVQFYRALGMTGRGAMGN